VLAQAARLSEKEAAAASRTKDPTIKSPSVCRSSWRRPCSKPSPVHFKGRLAQPVEFELLNLESIGYLFVNRVRRNRAYSAAVL